MDFYLHVSKSYEARIKTARDFRNVQDVTGVEDCSPAVKWTTEVRGVEGQGRWQKR